MHNMGSNIMMDIVNQSIVLFNGSNPSSEITPFLQCSWSLSIIEHSKI
jgi:hypothetical protein